MVLDRLYVLIVMSVECHTMGILLCIARFSPRPYEAKSFLGILYQGLVRTI